MDYLELIDQLIEIEKEFTGKNMFSEEYIHQLERRRKIYLEGYAQATKAYKEGRLIVVGKEKKQNG